jgi:hypothetical protein
VQRVEEKSDWLAKHAVALRIRINKKRVGARWETSGVKIDAERLQASGVSSRSGRADDARRARLISLLEAGHMWAARRSFDHATRSLAMTDNTAGPNSRPWSRRKL